MSDVDGSTLMLDRSEGVQLLRGVSGMDGPPRSNMVDQRVGFDGAVLIQSRRPERVVVLPLMIDLDTISEAEVCQRMQSGSLHAESDYGSRRLRNCVYGSGFEGEWSAQRGGVVGFGWRKFDVTFVALDPWWTDLNGSVAVLPIVAPTAYNAAIAYNAVLPYDGGSSLIVTVVGDAAAYPGFYVRGPFTTLTVSIAGVSWLLAGPLGDGVEMYVTTDTTTGGRGPRLAANNLVDWSLLTEASRLPTLPVGASSVVVGGTGTGSNSACTVSWVSRWLTP